MEAEHGVIMVSTTCGRPDSPIEPPLRSGLALQSRALLGVCRVLLATLLMSCSPSGTPVPQADYASRIVGGWQGTVGDVTETITFNGDGKFVSEVRPRGFISNTLGQGVTGTVRGTWQISGNAIKLNITSAQDARLADTATMSTIEKFEPDEIVVKSDKGDTSTFRRLL